MPSPSQVTLVLDQMRTGRNSAGVRIAIDAFTDEEVLALDSRARTLSSGVWHHEHDSITEVEGLVSANGHVRERAVRVASTSRGALRLLALRTGDWVPQVRGAARERLEALPPWKLRELLGFTEILTTRRGSAAWLDGHLEAQLVDADLRAMTDAYETGARRAAWRRLADRGAITPAELLERVAIDEDPMVRAHAARALPRVTPDAQRRALARTLAADPVGWLSARGLEALVELDGAAAITAALTARSAALRRHARGWAAVRGVDARAVYLRRIEDHPRDALALTALAEIADPRDTALLRAALADPRARVRAGALRATARLDPAAARPPAHEALRTSTSARVGRAAAATLRDVGVGDADFEPLAAVARDARRPPGARLRALALLRPARWRHLALLLELRADADDALAVALDRDLGLWLQTSAGVRRAPDPTVRAAVEAHLPDLAPDRRRAIGFLLRTTT